MLASLSGKANAAEGELLSAATVESMPAALREAHGFHSFQSLRISGPPNQFLGIKKNFFQRQRACSCRFLFSLFILYIPPIHELSYHFIGILYEAT